MKRVSVGALLVVLWLPSLAHADDINIGMGGRTCGAWLADREGQHEPTATGDIHVALVGAVTSWFQGFLFAASLWHPKMQPIGATAAMQAIPDADAVQAWLDNYCHEHPLEKVAAGAITLQSEVAKRLTP